MCEYYMDCRVCKHIGECSNPEEMHFSGMYPECEDFECIVKCHPERECISYEEREDFYK